MSNAEVNAEGISKLEATTINADTGGVGQNAGECEAHRDAFVVYRHWIDAIRQLDTTEEKLQMYEALMDYGFTLTYPQNAKGICKMWIKSLEPLMKSTKAKYDAAVKNGKKGGNPSFKKGQPNPYYPKNDNPNATPETTQDNKTLPPDNLRSKKLEDRSYDENNINNQTMRACAGARDKSLWITSSELSQLVAQQDSLLKCFSYIDEAGFALPQRVGAILEEIREDEEHGYLFGRLTREVFSKIMNNLFEPLKDQRGACFKAKQVTNLYRYIITVLQNEGDV